MFLNLLLTGCVQIHSKAYSLCLLSTLLPRHTIKDYYFSLKLHVYLWQNLNCLFIPGFSAGVKNGDFSYYPAAETVNERPLKGPGVPWQHFGGSYS